MKYQNPFNDPAIETRLFKNRVSIAIILMLICFLLLLGRLIYLEIIKYPYYSSLSYSNSIGLLLSAPPRGLIYDRNGTLIADNTPVFSLDVIPNKTDNLDKTVSDLQKLLNIDPEDIDRFYKQYNKSREFDTIPLKIKLTQEDMAKFYVNKYRFTGVKISVRLIRNYPYKNDFVSILGYVGRINQKEAKNLDFTTYEGIDYIGKIGIEKYFENDLRGKAGYKQVETNAQGQPVKFLKTVPSIPGNQLYLTIDANLQEVAVKAMKNYQGAVVVLDPKNGDVLAMVSNPSYDPNIFVRGITQKEYSKLKNSSDQPLFNRAIRGQYPPGSIIKPIFALQGLEKGFITPEFKIYDTGYFQLTSTSRKFHNWRRKGQGWINLRSAIAQSTDTYFYYLANKMGIENMDAILKQFGYGELTGIQIKEELPGLLPSPENKKKISGEKWYPGDTLNVGIGQGITLVTPLQLALVASIIAEHGTHYQPNLILKIIGTNGTTVFQQPRILSEIKFQPATWKAVIDGMEAVITDPLGTGYRFGKPNYTIASKTGTAQLFSLGKNEKYIVSKVALHLRDNSMFIAFAPIEHPKIAIAIASQNNPNAAQIARQVIDYYLVTEKKIFDKNGK